MKTINSQNNFIYLFFSLITLLFSAAVVADFKGTVSEDIFSIITITMLYINLKSLKPYVTWRRTAYALILFFISIILLGKFFHSSYHIYILLSILLIFFIYFFTIATEQVLFVGDIDTNKIVGSLTLYILLGLIWAVIYLLIIAFDSNSFTGIVTGEWQESFSRVAYYSFVTLTTLGYGDILPNNHIAEFFVYMESIIGVFYMAIIVSSLISLRLSAIQEKKKGD